MSFIVQMDIDPKPSANTTQDLNDIEVERSAKAKSVD